MISIRAALARLGTVRPALGIETVPLAAALGRTLAKSLTAPGDLPPFSRAAMDGYAVRSEDTALPPARLPVHGVAAAGEPPGRGAPGTATRIFTGAPLPMGMDAVIEQEAVISDGTHIAIARAVAAGRNVMPRAHQYAAGGTVFPRGERLTHVHLGTLAALGIDRVPVFVKPRVAVIQTGNELASAGQGLLPGAIYEVQARWLPLLIAAWGGSVASVRRVGDDLAAVVGALEDAVSTADLVLTSGGVSVGDFDYVPEALRRVADPLFWRVAMHPGKAVGAARRDRSLILSLSGNPAAALTSWSVLAAPWWAWAHGGRLHERQGRFPLLERYGKPTRETRFLRVVWTVDGLDWHLPQSADVLSDPWDSGYAIIPGGSPALSAGTVLTYWQPAGIGGSEPRWQGGAAPLEEFGPEAFGPLATTPPG